VLQIVAVCCSVRLSNRSCCGMLQSVAGVQKGRVAGYCRVLQGVVVCCRVLRGAGVVCCSVLQRVAVELFRSRWRKQICISIHICMHIYIYTHGEIHI